MCICVSGSGLNDGQWHYVELSFKNDHLSITVDKDEGATAHISISVPLTSDSQLFFGGKNTCIMYYFYIERFWGGFSAFLKALYGQSQQIIHTVSMCKGFAARETADIDRQG